LIVYVYVLFPGQDAVVLPVKDKWLDGLSHAYFPWQGTPNLYVALGFGGWLGLEKECVAHLVFFELIAGGLDEEVA